MCETLRAHCVTSFAFYGPVAALWPSFRILALAVDPATGTSRRLTHLAGRIASLHAQRCAQCHEPAQVSRLDWIDIQQPERSRFLQAPLAGAAGGSAKCKQTVYGDTKDEGYQAVLKLVTDAVRTAWDRPRRDLRAFLPDEGRRYASRSEAPGQQPQ